MSEHESQLKTRDWIPEVIPASKMEVNDLSY